MKHSSEDIIRLDGRLSLKLNWDKTYVSQTAHIFTQFPKDTMFSVKNDLIRATIFVEKKNLVGEYNPDTLLEEWINLPVNNDLWYNFLVAFWQNTDTLLSDDRVPILHYIACSILFLFYSIDLNSSETLCIADDDDNKNTNSTVIEFSLYQVLLKNKHMCVKTNSVNINMLLLAFLCTNTSYVFSSAQKPHLNNHRFCGQIKRESNDVKNLDFFLKAPFPPNDQQFSLIYLVYYATEFKKNQQALKRNNKKKQQEEEEIEEEYFVEGSRSSNRLKQQSTNNFPASSSSSSSSSYKKKKHYHSTTTTTTTAKNNTKEAEDLKALSKKTTAVAPGITIVTTTAAAGEKNKKENSSIVSLLSTAATALNNRSSINNNVAASSISSYQPSDIVIFQVDNLIFYFSEPFLTLQEDLLKETVNNVICARYQDDKRKNLLIKDNDDENEILNKNQMVKTQTRGIEKFANQNLIRYESGLQTQFLSNAIKLFKEKVSRPGSAFSKATKYVNLSLFNDFPISTWFSDEVATAYCLLLNQRESALRKTILNRAKILYLDQTFFALIINNIKIGSIMNLTNDEQTKQDKKLKKSFENFKLDSCEKIYMYANQNNNHWVLFEILVHSAKIIVYDSYFEGVSPTTQLQFNQIKYYIKINSIDQGVDKRWGTESKSCRFQRNTDDCGVYMLTFSLFVPDFSFEFVKQIDMKNARVKIAMDITRGYIEDPRLNGYTYLTDDASIAGLGGMPVFDYELFILDLTEDDDEEDDEEDITFILAKQQSLIESLESRIKQDQEILYITNNVHEEAASNTNQDEMMEKKRAAIELELKEKTAEFENFQIKAKETSMALEMLQKSMEETISKRTADLEQKEKALLGQQEFSKDNIKSAAVAVSHQDEELAKNKA
jgi:hypothetical protein